jgi:hypothetical protein
LDVDHVSHDEGDEDEQRQHGADRRTVEIHLQNSGGVNLMKRNRSRDEQEQHGQGGYKKNRP